MHKGACEEAWPCQEASRHSSEACKAGGQKLTCVCARKPGGARRPLDMIGMPAEQEARTNKHNYGRKPGYARRPLDKHGKPARQDAQ